MFKKALLKPICLLFMLTAFYATPAIATNQAMLDLLKILHERGSISAQEYQALINAAKTDQANAQEPINAMQEDIAEAKDDLPKINTNGKLEITSADGENKIRIGGRIQHDTTLIGKDGGYAGESESQLRRARIYLSGTWAKYWDFKFQYDLEDAQDNSQAIEDAYIRYTGFPVHIRVGQGKNPYSMHNLTSSKYITFIERSFASSLFHNETLNVGGKAMGLTFTWNDQTNSGFLAEGSLTVNRQSCDPATSCHESRLDDGHGFSGRISWADYDKKARQLIHAGLSGGYRNYPNGFNKQIRVRPSVSEGNRILSTRILAADSFYTFNANVAGMFDRFWGQAEYFYGEFDLATTTSRDTDMNGFLIQGGAFLTAGDNRRYNNGTWNSVKVKNPVGKGGFGAWEVALRYDYAMIAAGLTPDQTDQAAAAFSAALNFYPVNNIRLQANYVKPLCDGGSKDRCAWDNATTKSNPDFFILRAQTFF